MEHCACYYVPPEVYPEFVVDGWTELEEYLPSNVLANITSYVQNKGIQYGDLVSLTKYDGYRNDGLLIYNGIEVIELEYDVDDYGALPKEFQVLTHNPPHPIFPLTYWLDTEDYRGITHDSIIWFPHELVRDQCLSSLNRTVELGEHCTFICNEKEYKIVLRVDDDSTEDLLRDILLEEGPLVFYSQDPLEEIEPNHKTDNTLYLMSSGT